MDSQLILDTASRVVHVGTAVALVGGTVFMKFVLSPSAKTLSDDAHDQLRGEIMGRWKKFVHIGIGLFILSGVYNMMRMIPNHKGDSLYHALVGTKVLIALAIFFIASALVGSSKTFEGMRANRPKWLGVIVVLAAIVIAISGFVKVRKFEPPAKETTATVLHNRTHEFRLGHGLIAPGEMFSAECLGIPLHRLFQQRDSMLS